MYTQAIALVPQAAQTNLVSVLNFFIGLSLLGH
jgi:hypothetical protein